MFQFILNLHRRNSLLFWWGCICFLFACTALFFILFNQFNFLGILNWVESFQVSLSAALLSWSLGWIFFHHRSIPLIKWLSWAICLSSFFENALVFYRSWIAGSFLVTADYSIIRMRVAIKIIILVTVIISTWKLYTQKKIKISQHYLTGIIMGLVLFIFFVVWSSRGRRSIRYL